MDSSDRRKHQTGSRHKTFRQLADVETFQAMHFSPLIQYCHSLKSHTGDWTEAIQEQYMGSKGIT